MATAVKPRGTYADYKSGNYSDKVFIFELAKRNSNSTMFSKETKKPVAFPLSYMLPCVGTVYQKEPGGRTILRKIRYVPGEDSIFVDQQTPDDKFPKTKVYANFVNGRLTVDGVDSTRLDFFMNWDMNETKDGRDEKKKKMFKLVDTTVMAAKARQKDKVKFDVVNWCYTANFITKIEPLASLFFTHEQMSQNAEDIRYNLKLMAERDPDKFQRVLDDPNTERKITVKQAIKADIIVVNTAQNSIAWSQNPMAPFSVAAPGTDVIEDFVNKSKSGDGQRYYDAIYNLVNPVNVVETPTFVEGPKASDFVPPVNQIRGASESDEELLIMVRSGVEKGLIEISKTKVWWKYKSMAGQGEKGMVQKLRDTPAALAILKSELGIAETV